MAMNTFDALIALHEAERRIFGRLIDMGADTKMTKKIMALLMWLESEGGLKGLVKKISSQTDKVMAVVGAEAETALGFLEANALSPGASSISMPVTLDLAKPVPDSFSLIDLFEDKERASNGISHLVNGVCEMIFRDILEDRCKEGNGSVAMADIVRKLVVAEGKKPGGLEVGKKSAVVASSGSKLNPYAQEWRVSPEEERCLFVTFSNGYPLSENQIFWFFTSCVDEKESMQLGGELSFPYEEASVEVAHWRARGPRAPKFVLSPWVMQTMVKGEHQVGKRPLLTRDVAEAG
ncbi:uncharacterized protein LOC132300980 [Cornus florida]|uniref:uncharacterized protein LOC132300980 n=1 Tax=Cornus florida TaxID=4283 RepID=UPI00289AF658|nr:uncharacterized protein LOC132300980 [Cornus florida]